MERTSQQPARRAAARPRVIVTCGPAHEPIDRVRRLTNASTGELGARLADALHAAGFDVLCLRGEGATFAGWTKGARILPFTTNDDLLAKLRALPRRERIAAVFHAAALCDFRVKAVRDDRGRRLRADKISSRRAALTLELEPAAKVIASLRGLFPRAVIVGWKFELDGTRAGALRHGWRQIQEHATDACVVNGAAYGRGFGVCLLPGRVRHRANKSTLARWLAGWLKRRLGRGPLPALRKERRTASRPAPPDHARPPSDLGFPAPPRDARRRPAR